MSKINNWALRKVAAIQTRRDDEEGQGLAEYGLILALIAVVAIGALRLLGTNITGIFNTINTSGF
jgi:pilus assembly protein Flp/PilA